MHVIYLLQYLLSMNAAVPDVRTRLIRRYSSNDWSLTHYQSIQPYLSKNEYLSISEKMHFKKKIEHKRAVNVQAETNVNIFCYFSEFHRFFHFAEDR